MNTEEKEKRSVWRIVGKVIARFFLIILTTVLILVADVVGLVYAFNYGPSPSARSLFVTSVLETSAMGFLATWFLPSEDIQTILSDNKLQQFNVVSNPDLIVIPDISEDPEYYEENEIEIVPITGFTYNGRMIIVKDPSRVKVGTCANLGKANKRGETLVSMDKRYNALASINGGGFDDPNGSGTGTIPEGFVFESGKYLFGSLDKPELLIGFDADNRLIVGNMTGREAIELGIRDALTFGPALIINGEPSAISGSSSGLNPRTAIGQRADGAVLLLTVDGRQANSLGASYADLIEIFTSFGAINAANLDGGSSSVMMYENEIISNLSILTGGRPIPTCFYVERREENE